MNVHRVGRRPVEELILAAAEDALDPTEQATLDAHLSTCGNCASIAAQHRRIAERLNRIPDATSAQRVSLARVREAARRPVRPPLLQVAFAVLVVALLVAGFVGVRTGAARPAAPERELILERTEVLDGNDIRLVVEDGRAVALPGHASGVLVRVTIRLKDTGAGRAEIRFAAPGQDYGVLASVTETSGLRALSMEGRFLRPDASTIFDVWVHLERPSPVDTAPIRVRVDPVADGERARLP